MFAFLLPLILLTAGVDAPFTINVTQLNRPTIDGDRALAARAVFAVDVTNRTGRPVTRRIDSAVAVHIPPSFRGNY